ncbi:unnamed protein product [Caenorhabditis bovis]|uniref:17S U2 SnRNP complex component HTATSF1 n=1 Tax=Caenorhabditis bovis TaxID=2654633 RepID=A0A8S1F5T7_9PELO|nr:unnamed protein product [Caenorhabditis bovis]
MSDVFVPETEEGEELENIPKTSETIVEKQADVQVEESFVRRYINEKWYGRYGNAEILEFVNDDWVLVKEDEQDFILQLWMEQEAEERKNYVWDEKKNEWVTKKDNEVDEDFIAQYQANYGVPEEYADIYKKMDEELKEKTEKAIKQKEEKKEKKKKTKLGVEESQPEGWVEIQNTAVYVSNLPTDITDEEFHEFMAKCGVVQPDPRTNKPKIKLYRDENGDLKGDGRCCYIKPESVELACNILDGTLLNGKVVKVEEARFEMKGDFDPTKKKRKLTAAQKKRFMAQQNKIFEWQPEKPRNYRPPSDCTVIVKNLFTLEQMAKNAALLLDLKEEMELSCQKYGTVKKVVVYDNHPEGVVSVTFTNTEESDMAVKFLNGRVVDGRKLSAELWDGKTKYKIQETEEDEERRRKEYEKYISGGAAESDDDEEDGESKKPKLETDDVVNMNS